MPVAGLTRLSLAFGALLGSIPEKRLAGPEEDQHRFPRGPPLPGCTFADTSSPQVVNAGQDPPQSFLLSRLDSQGAKGSLELCKGVRSPPLLFSLQEGRESRIAHQPQGGSRNPFPPSKHRTG